MGNLFSVYSAFDFLGEKVSICKHPEDLKKADKIVIPGVGAFKDCIQLLNKSGFTDALNEEVMSKCKPTLGICLGMQVMASQSFEFGEFKGLGWFDADVVKINIEGTSLKLPNIGWNEIQYTQSHKVFDGIKESSDFYLVHSYFMKCKAPDNVLATYKYGDEIITAAVVKDNIIATQFHPEKSQDHGLSFLENFINWTP